MKNKTKQNMKRFLLIQLNWSRGKTSEFILIMSSGIWATHELDSNEIDLVNFEFA